MSSHPLAALERLRLRYGAGAAQEKRALLTALARCRLGSARAVARLHEALCFIRAYPDDAGVLRQARAMLEGFARRPDVRAHRAALADTGIAGTAIHYRFFAGQAQWLAQRWPRNLRLDRADPDAEARIARALPTLVTPVEAAALAECKPEGYEALDRLRGAQETDAVFLLRRIAAMPGDGFTREAFSDAIDASFVLASGADTPSRTLAHFDGAPRAFRREPPPRARPELRVELVRPPRSVRRLSRAAGAALVDLARGAMVTRARSLEAFSFADARDAWLVDDGDGLSYGFMGVIPERRHPLVAYYGSLTLRNGVPIGYAQADVVGASAALSFNTFETFRGAEAAFTFARWLAALRHVFGATAYSIEPYQLGHHNDEALESGAWWFYAKLGFRPRDRETLALVREETLRSQRSARYRTPPARLRRLAERHVFFELDPSQRRPRVDLAVIGLEAGAALSRRAGSDRTRAAEEARAGLMRQCGLDVPRGLSRDEREAWRRMAPVLALLDPGGWRDDERRALAEVVRAKGGRSERDYLARYRAHPRLDAALVEWLQAHPGRRNPPKAPMPQRLRNSNR